MSIFSKPKTPKLKEPEKVEGIEQVQEDEVDVARRERRKRVMTGGRQSTIVAGLQQALKQRLGQ